MPDGLTAVPEADELVPALLDEYGAITRVTLSDYLAPREPKRHLYDIVGDYPRRGGRMLRPTLCLAATKAFGGSLEDAMPAAVALELLHNAFLVHDDVEDESDERRGQPTLNALHGDAIAINVGDTLSLVGLRALMDSRPRLGPALTLRLLEEAEQMARESVEGQSIELGWRQDNTLDLTDGDYLKMVLKKTGWYTAIFPLRIGALIGRRGNFDPCDLVPFGSYLGAAFQIQDDLLNLQRDDRYGKEANGDIWEGKRTLMLIHLLRKAKGPERRRLERFLAHPRKERTSADVLWVRERMDDHRCLEYARTIANALAGAATELGSKALSAVPESRDKRFILGLAVWVLNRT